MPKMNIKLRKKNHKNISKICKRLHRLYKVGNKTGNRGLTYYRAGKKIEGQFKKACDEDAAKKENVRK